MWTIKTQDLLNDWRLLNLSDVVFFQEGPGVRKHQFTKNGIKLLNVRNLVDNQLKLDNTETHISKDEATTKYNHFLVEEGDLIIASSGIKVDYFHKKIAFVKKEHLPLCMNTSTIRFRTLDENILDIQYFRYFLMTRFFSRQVNFHITGSAQLNFGPSHLKKMTVIIPPLPTQKKIVAILEKAEKLKGWRKEADELTDEFLKSTFLEMFGDPVKNPIGWSVKKIKEVIVDIQAGWSVNGESKPRLKNEFAVLKVSAVTSGVFLPNECKVINGKDLKKIVTPEKGDVLFSRANTLELVGATCLITENYPFLLLPDKLWKIKVEKMCILSEYLKFVLSHSAIRKKISALSTGTSGSMYNISMKKFGLINIAVPPIEIQDEFVKIVEKDEQIRKYQTQSRQHIDDLFNALMQQAFRGELS